MIPTDDIAMMRSHPQKSDIYLVIQQPQRFTEGEYIGWREWTDYDWSCRIAVAPMTDPTVTLDVNLGSPAKTLLDGMTVLIGSAYGEWDKVIVRLRGDQVVGPATATLNIATSSDIRDVVKVGDYVVVLDEFRLWQRYSRVTTVGGTINWYKDYDVTWASLGANDAGRRLAMMPPVPIMGPHAVKFIDPPAQLEQFWFDWQNSYATAPGAVANSWVSWGERDHAGNIWNSVAQVPGWQTTLTLSGLRGFRTVLEVDDGNGNAVTLPYRRGVRYVFTLRRPGQTQVFDPPNSEPLTAFKIDSAPTGSFRQGYWRTSITVFGDDASKYLIMPGSLVILFTEDWYVADSPYLAPRGDIKASLGPIFDRENILLVGRIDGATIEVNPETQDVSFDVISSAEEAAQYVNAPVVINNKADSTSWIDTPSLTVDRAVRYYLAWHSTMTLVADVYKTGDGHSIFAQDFMEGDIYSTIDRFLWDRLFARLLCDKYGRFFCDIDAQIQIYGTVTTLWTLDNSDWLDQLRVVRYEKPRCKAVEVGGVVYFGGDITPKLGRAPGTFDKYRGGREEATHLAIDDQTELNALSGRFLQACNADWEIGFALGGNWRWLDIVPQGAVYVNELETERGTILNKRLLIREVTNEHHETGCTFTSIATEIEMDDGVPGVTVDIPPDIPPPDKPDKPKEPGKPGPYTDTGRRIIATDYGVFATNDIGMNYPTWYSVNAGVPTARLRCWWLRRDPWHWWTTGGADRTLWGLFEEPAVGLPYHIYKMTGFPYGTWTLVYSASSVPAAGAFPFVSEFAGSIEADGLWYALVANTIGGNAWIARTVDGGLNWTHPGIAWVGIQNPSWEARESAMDLGHHSGGNMIYVAMRQFIGEPIIRRSQNAGVAWDIPGQPGFMGNAGALRFHIPYVSAAWTDTMGYLLTTIGGDIARSDNLKAAAGSVVWSPRGIVMPPGNYSNAYLDVCPDDPDRVVVVIFFDQPAGGALDIYQSINGGVTWTTWHTNFTIAWRLSKSGLAKWTGTTLENVLVHNRMNNHIYLVHQAGYQDKTGNLLGINPSMTRVSAVERDTMGGA